MIWKNLLFGLVLASLIFSAGSGSGGSSSGSTGTSCTQDIWSCGEYGACSSGGVKTRTCTLISDCEKADTKKPEEVLPCNGEFTVISNLKCQYKTEMKERIKCRLELKPEEMLKELEISYLPEECRALEKETFKSACVKDYASVQKCWLKEDSEVDACLREVTGLPMDVKKETSKCKALTQPSRGLCTVKLRDSAYKYIKFKMYYLEEEAEELMKDGKANKEDVVDLIEKIELKKQEFNEVNTNLARSNVVKSVQQVWKDFIKKLKGE